MKKKHRMIAVLIVFLLILAAGCGQVDEGNQAPSDNGSDNPESPYPMTIVDDAGRTVEIEAEPQRIVSLMPSLTETLFAVGLGDRVVGVTSFCNYPEAALEKEKVGSLFDLNTEMILSLEPDLVLTGESDTLQDVLDFLTDNGLTVVVVDPQNLDEIEEAIREVGKITGVPEKGADVAADVAAQRAALNERVGAVADENRPSVFILLDTEAIYTMGQGVFLADIVHAAGGVNAAADKGEGYFQLSEEALLELNPEIIINTFPMRDQVMAKTSWQEIEAIKNGRVYDVDGDLVSRPGPRIILGLEELYNVFFAE
ncbi:MAG: cobalamin-binding protein [Bacillota bacterium]|nr:cobalamin-binding protein [Bacillota bacterium]MDW7684090.1 cobalamin-binding protein [Bacillota bacterium]